LKSELLRHFRVLFQEKKVRLNKRLLIFFFFLLLSSFIWLLNSLDKEYITELNFPVYYYNFPEDKIETLELPDYFTFRVEASGYLLLKHKIGRSLYPLEIDISKYLPDVLLRDTLGFSIKTSNFREGIENQLSQQIKVIDIKPENIKFLFARKISKEIPVIPVIKYKLDKQLVIKNKQIIKPEKVVVSGPVNVLDTLKSVFTIKKDLGLVSEFTTDKLEIQPINNLTYSIENVNLNIIVEKYTESSFKVPVTIINCPDSISIQIIPEMVTVDYCTGLSNFNNIKPSHFILVADYKEINSNATKLSVLIKNHPSQAFNINLFPRTVNFIIKSNKP
jgi:hypothetical protein